MNEWRPRAAHTFHVSIRFSVRNEYNSILLNLFSWCCSLCLPSLSLSLLLFNFGSLSPTKNGIHGIITQTVSVCLREHERARLLHNKHRASARYITPIFFYFFSSFFRVVRVVATMRQKHRTGTFTKTFKLKFNKYLFISFRFHVSFCFFVSMCCQLRTSVFLVRMSTATSRGFSHKHALFMPSTV